MLTRQEREKLRTLIEREAISYSVQAIDNNKIDEINILQAAILGMHQALDELKTKFKFIIVDGNYFKPYKKVPHQTIIEGDAKYLSIAAASILAKTYRDEHMEQLHEQFPHYGWSDNKGYATPKHRKAIKEFGQCPLHRRSFVLKELQLELELVDPELATAIAETAI